MADLRNNVIGILSTLASANKYQVMITNAEHTFNDIDILCKTVILGEYTRGEAEYWKDGIKYAIPREISYNNELSITIMQDEKTDIRGKFIAELNVKNRRSMNIKVHQLKKQKNSEPFAIVEYTDCFVKSVSNIELSSSTIEVPEFTVTIGYNWMTTEVDGELHNEKEHDYTGS